MLDEVEIGDDVQLLLLKSENTEIPSTGILIKHTSLIEETGRKKVFEISVLLKFHIKRDKIDKLPGDNLVVEYQKSGTIKIGVKAQKRLSSQINSLKACKFTIHSPREAKCCTSWLDIVLDPQDLLEDLKIRKITAIRNCHAILNSVKRAHCIICHRETPGINQSISDFKVLEEGEKTPLIDGKIQKFLKKSKVLAVSVQLDQTFNSANQCEIGDNFIKGVCVDCSKYFYVDSNNDVKPNHNYVEYINQCRSEEDTEQELDDEFDTNWIAPYSEYNLMSTNIWNDEAYDLFCENSLTLLEKIVLTPLHVSVTVMRLRTNDIPFSAHGVICYPLQKK